MKTTFFALTIGVALAVYATVFAQQADDPVTADPVVLTDEQGQYPLGLHIDILEDPSGELTIEDITSPEYAAQFERSTVEVPVFGFTDSAYWVRLSLLNHSLDRDRWLLETGFPNMSYVDLYTALPNRDGFAVKQSGALRPPENRDIPDPHIVFDLTVPPQGTETVHLRFQSGASMTILLRVWNPDNFLLWTKQAHFVAALYFGAMFVLIAYHLMLFALLHEKSHLYLVMALSGLLIFETGYAGYAQAYLSVDPVFLEHYYLPLSFALLNASLVLFALGFLELARKIPTFYWLGLISLAGWVVLAILSPFTTYRWIATLSAPWAVFSLVIIFVAAIVAWKQDFPHALFFIIASFGVVIALTVVLLVRQGAVLSTPLTENAYRVGMVWLGVCWSLALTGRVNRLKNEIQRSEQRLSQILQGLPIGVVMYGNDRKATFANRRVNEILGNPARGIMPDPSAGRTLEEAMELYSFCVDESDQKYPLERMPVHRALQGEVASADDIQADLIDRRVPLEIWASPIEDDAGNVESAVVAFRDITERRNAQVQLDQYRTHLEDLVEQRTSELSEINTLLNREVAERQMLATIQSKLVSWLSAVNKIHHLLSGTARLPQAYEQLLVDVYGLVGARSAFLGSWDRKTDQIELLRCLRRSDSQIAAEQISIQCQMDSPLRRMIEQGDLLVLSPQDKGEGLALLAPCLEDPNIATVVLAPARAQHGVTGFLGLGLPRDADSLTDHEIALFQRMGSDLAELSTYAYLYDTVRKLAATEERNRLARDLHDSVTQVLFSANLLADVLPTIWRRDPEQAEASLEGLRRLTRGALAEMRTLLLELRPAAVVKTPLPDLLSQLTDAVISRSTVQSRLHIQQVPELPQDVHMGFYRVAQEALNNVVKHSQATLVDVRLNEDSITSKAKSDSNFTIRLTISDNGIGFEWDQVGAGHMGLAIMRERADAINASLSMDSQIGHGTIVALKWQKESGSDDD